MMDILIYKKVTVFVVLEELLTFNQNKTILCYILPKILMSLVFSAYYQNIPNDLNIIFILKSKFTFDLLISIPCCSILINSGTSPKILNSYYIFRL